MVSRILRCVVCLSYFLSSRCKNCGGECVSPRPAKFNVLDRYGSYRRVAKRRGLSEGGLL